MGFIGSGNKEAQVLADALHKANEEYLLENKSPSRKVNELDNRGSHFFLAKYWAEALSEQGDNKKLRDTFKPVAEQLNAQEQTILKQLIDAQGKAVDLGGYFELDNKKATAAMRPSEAFNSIINKLIQA